MLPRTIVPFGANSATDSINRAEFGTRVALFSHGGLVYGDDSIVIVIVVDTESGLAPVFVT